MKRKNKAYSLQRSAKVLLLVLLPILVINLLMGGVVISIVRYQTTQYLTDNVKLYINRIDSTFASIKHYLGWSAVNNSTLADLAKIELYKGDFNTLYQDVFSRFYEFQYTCGSEYNFFMYIKDKDYFTNISSMSMDLREYRHLKEEISKITSKKDLYESYSRFWTTINIDGKEYLLNLIPYHDVHLVCIISAEDFLAPLEDLKLGDGGSVSILDSDENTENISTSFFQRYTSLTEPIKNASFQIQIKFDNFGAFEKIIAAQLLLLIISISIAGLAGAVVLFMRKRVLAPIHYFSENLKSFNENSEPLDFKSSDIIELEQVNLQFKNLISEIKRLKIDIYEKELEHQQVQLDYMQLQIKPHFFLNCLTNIYSMAQVGMNDEIERLCLSTSNYFRYIFQNTGGFVTLKSEIAHVQDYLDIQKTSFGEEFSYSIELEPSINQNRIPPLVLQTFVENAVKYGVSLNGDDNILISAVKEGENTVISIEDTGAGFPEEILQKLQSSIPLERVNGHHIGIANTVRRLQLTYGNKFSVSFKNRQRGAQVTISIPCEPLEINSTEGSETQYDSSSG